MLHRAVSCRLRCAAGNHSLLDVRSPRLRFDGCYISVVTYLRRGESNSIYAPTHLITFYRYLRFYASVRLLSALVSSVADLSSRT